jgi:hypothetical protein
MIQIFLWSIVSYGITTIVVYGSIFNGFRNTLKLLGEKSKVINFFSTLIHCPLCFSTWVGFFLSISLFSVTDVFLNLSEETNFMYVFFDGMYSAGIVWIINTIVEFFEESRIK